MEQKGLSWQGIALVGSIFAYLLARPGKTACPLNHGRRSFMVGDVEMGVLLQPFYDRIGYAEG